MANRDIVFAIGVHDNLEHCLAPKRPYVPSVASKNPQNYIESSGTTLTSQRQAGITNVLSEYSQVAVVGVVLVV